MATTVPTPLPVWCLLRLVLYFKIQWLLFLVIIICDSRQHLFEGAVIPLASLWILKTQLAIYQYSIEALSQHTFGTKTSVKTTVVNAKKSPEKTAASILM